MAMELLNGKKKEIAQALESKYNDFKDAMEEVAAQNKKAIKQVNRLAHQKPWSFVTGVALGGMIVGFIAGWKAKK